MIVKWVCHKRIELELTCLKAAFNKHHHDSRYPPVLFYPYQLKNKSKYGKKYLSKPNIVRIIFHAVYVILRKGDLDLILIILVFFHIERLIQDVF